MNLKNPQGKVISDKYDYGPLDEVAIFTDSHPAVMKKWISKFNWQDELYSKSKSNIKIHKHQSMRVKILTWLEGILYNHKDSIGGFKNYNIIKNYKCKSFLLVLNPILHIVFYANN
jgi:hypothetical protein